MKSTQSSSPQDNNNAVDSSNGSPKVPPLRIVFSTTSASGSIGANAANVDHTYSSSGDSTATSTAAEETSAKPRKRQKTGNSDVTTSSSSFSAAGRSSNPSQTSVSSTPSVGTKKHHHHHHHHHQHHRTTSNCSSSSSSSGSKKKHSSSSSESEEEMNAEHSGERNEATAAGNGVTSPKSSCPSNTPSSSNTLSSKPTSPATNQSEPKVPSLRIVISSSGSTSATSSVSQTSSSSDINKVSSSNASSSLSSTSTKNLPYVVSSSTTSADANEEVGTTEYETSGSSGVSTSANISTSGRVTRSSQRAAQQQQQKGDVDNERHTTSPTSTSSSSGKRENSAKDTSEANQGGTAATGVSGSGSSKDDKPELKDQMPRKRKLRNKQHSQNQQGSKQSNEQDEDNESTSSSTSSGVGTVAANCANTSAGTNSVEKEAKNPKEFQMPSYNCYHMYLNIRKQVDKRRRQMFPVQPKAPQGFKDYLLNKGSYLLEGKICLQDTAGNGRSIPVMTPPPAMLKPGTGLYNLHIDQEKTRQKLRLRHTIEKEKLQLSTEQEVLRVHGRAALAMANQSVPFSVCTILKDEEIYNTIESEADSTSAETVTNNGSTSSVSSSRNEYQRTTYTTSSNSANSATDLVTLTGTPSGPGARSRYNGRLFISWLQDVDDKWEKIKADTISRQKRESESLHAIQKLEWEWKMKELGACDVKSSPQIDDTLVPAVQVSEDFDLLPV